MKTKSKFLNKIRLCGLIPVGLLFAGMALSSTARADAGRVDGANKPAASLPAKKITGVVLDADGYPVGGANVLQKGTTNGSVTNAEGRYSITVPDDAVLVVSCVGFVTLEVPAAEAANIVLHDDTQLLGEVVVTALGIKREQKSLGYALQELDGGKLLESRDVNVTNSLSGKISGLQVVKGAGGAGGSSKIILRGQNSLTGDNQPLIVIDGVPIDNTASGNTDVWGASGMDMGNGLQDINPDDIESLTVLKGASAAALYGSRAGNGVILITTKSGKSQQGLGITVSSGISVENIFVKPKLQSSFGQGADGIYNPVSVSSWGPEIAGQTVTDWNNRNVAIAAYDNTGNFFRTGITDNESVSFQQQIGSSSVYASVIHTNNRGIVPETEMNRTSVVARATTNLGSDDRWKLDFKLNYVNTNTYNRPIQGINQDNVYRTISTLPRSLDIRDFNPSVVNGKQVWFDTQTMPQDNPWWSLQYNRNNDTRNRYIGFISLSYKFTDWLSGEIKAGTDFYNTKMYHRKHSGSLSVPKNGVYEEGLKEFKESNYSYLFVARKDKLWNDFGGSLTFGGNMMEQAVSDMSASSGELLISNLFSLNNGIEKPVVNTNHRRKKMNSLYGSLQLAWRNALYLDATARNDWSSTMSKANRSYFYPSVSFSGIVSELVELPSWFTFLKLRASYAEVGNDLQPYQLYNTYTVGKDYWGVPVVSSNPVLYDDTVVSELIKSWEAGLDLRFFDGRLKLDAAWYKTNSTNQLLKLPMNEASGYESKIVNAGNILNTGVELMLSGRILDNADGLNWLASLNFSKNRNEIVHLYKGVDVYMLDKVDELMVVAEAGKPFGNIYGSSIRRVKDKNSPHYGKPVLTGEGLPQRGENTSEYLGNQQPDFMLGFGSGFEYRGITLDFQVDARVGGEMFSMTKSMMNGNGLSAETAVNGKRESFVADGVILQGDGQYVPNSVAVTPQRYWTALGQGNFGIAEANIYDATSVRLRTLSVGYNFPKKMLEKTPIRKLRCSLTGNNVWMIYTGAKGIDPETLNGTGTNSICLDLLGPPATRSFTFNVTIGF
ncbi:MAG: SusC/RagA family TonB-linked outer membrane protein [Prevotellaceae bacterium]|jgi:TonB-linked SusC/RagA family outer membrane protein|nr:SusC/RagA family TonB-linked outer membrane protein [Prevotellaceae bacterium]